jgi:agmatinase
MLYTKKTFDLGHPLEEADVILLGLPFDSTQTGRPCRLGPLFIRESIKNMEGFDPETGKNPFSSLKFADAGDLEFVPGSWKLTEKRIIETVKEIKERNPDAFLLSIGGDHLNTLGILRGLEKFHKPLTVVHLDAHTDLLLDWLGEKNSHVTWARRAVEGGFNLVQPACRIWKPEEREFAVKNKIHEKIGNLKGPVYLTVDLDILDPSIAPEVGTPEPEGLSLHQVWNMLKDVFERKQIEVVGADVMECASDRPYTQTALAAASIIKKSLAYRLNMMKAKKSGEVS